MKAYFRVKTQFENIGDALINRELIKLVANYCDMHVCVKNVPENFQKNINLNKDSDSVFNSTVKFFFSMLRNRLNRERVVFFLNPGGVAGNIGYISFFKSSILNFIFLSLRLVGVEIYRFGVSFSNLNNLNKIKYKIQSRLINQTFVRDTISELECMKSNIKISGVIPDLAFLLPVVDFESATAVNKREYTLGISFRCEKNKKEILEYLDNLVKNPIGKVVIFYQVDFDLEFQKELFSRYSALDIELKDLTRSIDENIEFYRKCKYIVSNRLHVLLMGMSVGCIPLAYLDYIANKKIVGIFEDNGLQDYINKDLDFQSFEINSNDIVKKVYLRNSKLINQSVKDMLSLNNA